MAEPDAIVLDAVVDERHQHPAKSIAGDVEGRRCKPCDQLAHQVRYPLLSVGWEWWPGCWLNPVDDGRLHLQVYPYDSWGSNTCIRIYSIRLHVYHPVPLLISLSGMTESSLDDRLRHHIYYGLNPDLTGEKKKCTGSVGSRPRAIRFYRVQAAAARICRVGCH